MPADRSVPGVREHDRRPAEEAERHGPDPAHRLVLAAETMDEAAIFTIDAWCQRMLREHAFDSGSLFDEELVSDERALFEDAAHDYWRQHVYPMNSASLGAVLGCWRDVGAMNPLTPAGPPCHGRARGTNHGLR